MSLENNPKAETAAKPRIEVEREQIAEFCRRWKIEEFALFGSVLREDFGPDSDVDALAKFAPDADWSFFDHVRMEEELGRLFGRKVDLVSCRAIERSANRTRRESILTSAQVIYAA